MFKKLVELVEAVKYGNLSKIKRLVSKECDIHYRDDYVLRHSAERGHKISCFLRSECSKGC
jgi:hypothetical protein